MPVRFLKLKDPYGCFSNFWKCDIVYNGETWKTSEHAYQAQKYLGSDPEFYKQIKKAASAWDAAILGRRGRNIRHDWDMIRVGVMEEIVLAKFTQHEDLRKVLLSTGDQGIIEDLDREFFWAIGDGTGRNEMGKVLMRVRERVRDLPFNQLSLL